MITNEQIRDAAIAEACKQFGTTRECVRGRPRSDHETMARHAVCAALRGLNLSYAVIGALTDRHPGATMNSMKVHLALCDTSRAYKSKAEAVAIAVQLAKDGCDEDQTQRHPTPTANELSAIAQQIARLEEDLAQRTGQLRNALTERDRFRMQAEQKRGIRTELRKALGMPDTVTIEEECEWALYRISGLQIAARQRDELLTSIRETSAAAVILGEVKP